MILGQFCNLSMLMREENWVIRAKRADFGALADHFGISPVTARIIRNRGLETIEEYEQYLNGTLEDLHSPVLLSGARQAAELLKKKIDQKQAVRVIGDYDIDGVCASYILVRALRECGAKVDYDLPERLKDGYGLNRRLIEKAFNDNIDTILTCDNGIAAIEEIRYARQLGMTVIVTDHHEPGYENEGDRKVLRLPPANAVVNPSLPDNAYPCKMICGAVTAWKVISILYELSGFPKEHSLIFLDFAAFATIGDVMDLRGENRLIVKYGLQALMNTSNYGMRALIRACMLEGKQLSAYHVGFILGPCVNAGGRLDTAMKALSMFLSDDRQAAMDLAQELVRLNQERKEITEQGVSQAAAIIEQSGLQFDPVLVLYLPGCHESVAGIISGRIREQYHKPNFVLTDAQTPGMIKGSGRSIEEYNMFDALVATEDLLEKYGGHPMAAGVTLKKENLSSWRRALNWNCTLSKEDLIPKIRLDAAMPISYLTEELIKEFSLLEPFGKGNERPLFAQKNLRILRLQRLGKTGQYLKMILADESGRKIEAVFFGDADHFMEDLKSHYAAAADPDTLRNQNITCSAVYYPTVNEYRGLRQLQITVTNYKF